MTQYCDPRAGVPFQFFCFRFKPVTLKHEEHPEVTVPQLQFFCFRFQALYVAMDIAGDFMLQFFCFRFTDCVWCWGGTQGVSEWLQFFCFRFGLIETLTCTRCLSQLLQFFCFRFMEIVRAIRGEES